MNWLLNILSNAAGGVLDFATNTNSATSRAEYLADREHTEMREDTAYQRGVEDMRKAGLNPYTIGSNPAPSSSSSVGANSVSNRLQMLGYILDIANLSLKNKKLANDQLSTILGSFKN